MTITPPGTDADLRENDETIRLRVREPADLVVLVPYLLHFHPTESMVAVLFEAGRLVLTARFDLPPIETPVPELVAELDHLSRRTGASQIVLLGYSERPEYRSVLERLAAACPVELLDALWVSGGRWWSVICDQDCCPREGRPFDALSHPMAAEAVLAGMRADASRGSVADVASGPTQEHQRRLSSRAAVLRKNLTGTRRTRQRRMRRALRVHLERRDPPTELEALTLGLLATDVHVRDVALLQLTRASADANLQLWAAVVRQVPDDLAAAPLCLLGVSGWLGGNGALLNACVERLQSIAPAYSLGHICCDIADRALPPRFWDSLVDGLTSDAPC